MSEKTLLDLRKEKELKERENRKEDSFLFYNQGIGLKYGRDVSLMFSYLLFKYNWFFENKWEILIGENDGWFFQTEYDIVLQTGINEKPMKKSIKKLVELGVLQYQVRNVKRHLSVGFFKVDVSKFNELKRECLTYYKKVRKLGNQKDISYYTTESIMKSYEDKIKQVPKGDILPVPFGNKVSSF